jgi:hypothetical protein
MVNRNHRKPVKRSPHSASNLDPKRASSQGEEMPDPPTDDPDSLQATYAAIVGYHNSLALVRFTVAGIYVAATLALLGIRLGENTPSQSKLVVSLAGLVLSFIVMALDVRTYHLLENLGQRGLEIEPLLQLTAKHAFFDLMRYQPLPWRWPISRKPYSKYATDSPTNVRINVSISGTLDLLYKATLLLWIALLIGPLWPYLLTLICRWASSTC